MSEPQQPAAPTIEQLVAAEQVRELYGTIKKTAIIAPASSIPFLALLWSAVDHRNAILWWSMVFVSATPVSLGILYFFRRKANLPERGHYWLRLYGLRCFIMLIPATSVGLLWVPHSPQHQVIVLGFFVCVTAIIVSEGAYYRPLCWIGLPISLGPSIVIAAFEPASMLMAAIVAGMLVFLMTSGLGLNTLLMRSLRLRFANEELVQQLQAEKSVAETARDRATRAVAVAEAAHKNAVEANLAKSRFLAAASHDLRQPMHALGLYATAIRPFVTAGQGQQIVDKIESSVTATETLFSALLDISRLDAGILTPEIKPLAVNDLLNRLALEYTPRAEEKGLRLRVRPCALTIATDALLFERILRNYLSNAIRYTQHGGILLGCRVRSSLLSVEVWDTGVGIASDKLHEIYQEFYQIGNPERDRAKGLGLGLAIVKRTAELLAHPITVRSVPGRGSMFSVMAPLTSEATQNTIDDGLPPADESLLVGATVLVIDDETDVLNAMSILLEQWGCAVVAAGSCVEALTALRRLDTTPNVILSDYRLRDGETGTAAIQAIQLEWGAIPAALLTGDTAPDRLLEAVSSGYALLHKPINPVRLKVAVCRLLAASKWDQISIH